MSNRLSDGTRRNQWGGNAKSTSRKADGEMREPGRPSHAFVTRKELGEARRAAVEAGLGKVITPRDSSHWSDEDGRKAWNYVPPAIANPGNLIRTSAGRNHAGHFLAHDNEAPFPERVAEWFIRSLCPPGGIVLDNFSGSGTTASVAVRHGRRAIGADLRQSQCLLGRRRIAEQLLDMERPHRPKARRTPGAGRPVQASLFDEEEDP